MTQDEIKEKEKEEKERIKEQKMALRELYKTKGAQEMSDNELLSLLLGFSPGIKDPFEAASYLLTRYGSFSNIFNTSIESLLNVSFMDQNAALLIKGIPELCRRQIIESFPKNMRIKSPTDAKEYLYPYFIGYNMELAYLLLLDKKSAPIKTVQVGKGFTQSVELNPELICKEALFSNASAIVLAHSHPAGEAKPSRADEAATIRISTDMSILKIKLLDHLIFSRNDCYSMAAHKTFDADILAFSGQKLKKR